MIVVADAAPLIFLAKLNRLELISRVFEGEILVPSLVADEVLRPPLPPNEELLLQSFLETAVIVKTGKTRRKSLSLSAADLSVHQLAVERKATYVLTDDRLLRSLLETDGLVPMGTIGILIQALNKKLLTKKTVRSDLDDLIRNHSFRIGIELYERILEYLAKS